MRSENARTRWPLLRAEEMRALEAQSVADGGTSYAQLMERAGEAVAATALTLLAERYGTVLIACGPGHNGGDGLVAARKLFERRVPVTVWPLLAPEKFRGLAADAWRRAQDAGVPALEAGAQIEWAEAALIIDALFGTGTTRGHGGDARGALLAAHIAKINAAQSAGARVLAVDLPTGVLADTGQLSGEPVRATHTLALGAPKIGHACEPGRAACGRIQLARLGMNAPPARAAHLLSPARAPHEIPPRAAHMHKGDAGHVLAVAGSAGKTGAAALAALGAHRCGAGLVTIACRASIHSILEVKCTEAMTLPLPEARASVLDEKGALYMLENFGDADAVVIGPGLGTDAQTFNFVRALVHARRGARIVLDADALRAFAGAPEALAHETSASIVLTPHPGEAAALLGVTTRAVNADRAAAARALAERSRCCVVLKGAGTMIAHAETSDVQTSTQAQPHAQSSRAQNSTRDKTPAHSQTSRTQTSSPTQTRTQLTINSTGNPLLAAGGSGDVLAGVLGALLASRAGVLPVAHAVELGVWLHGAAADRLARRIGFTGALASEIADALPATLKAETSRATSSARAPAAARAENKFDVVAFP